MSFQQYNVYDGLTSCRLVAISNQSGTYDNGILNNGVGATFTYATGALTIDSVAVNVGDSVAFVGQTNTNENGIYVCTQAGATGVSAVLQRRQDMQCIEQLKVGQWCAIGAGTLSAGSMFVVVEPLPQRFGIDGLVLTSMVPAGLGTASTKAASDNTKSIVASVGSATQVGYIAHFVDTSGTVDDTSGSIIHNGTIQSGISGGAGGFIAYPATAGNGTFRFLPVNAGGAFNTTISNGTMGQSSVITIPDPGAATANFLLDVKAGGQSLSSSTASATPGTIRALRGLMTGTNATMTSGNLVGVRGEVDYVGASGGFVYGSQGKIIPTGTLSGSSWNIGVFGQVDISGATINAGQIAPIWGDYGATSGTLTDRTGMYGIAMTNTTAAVLNSNIYLFGGATNLLQLNDNNGGVGASYFVAAGTSAGSAGDTSKCNASRVLKISVNSVDYWIPLFASNS